MNTMLSASAIFVMDIETYEELMILRQQMLDAGAQNAIVQDLTPEREEQLRRELHPEWNDDEESEDPCRITEEDLDWTIWDEIDISPSDWYLGNF